MILETQIPCGLLVIHKHNIFRCNSIFYIKREEINTTIFIIGYRAALKKHWANALLIKIMPEMKFAYLLCYR
jgi:hypothetical protein